MTFVFDIFTVNFQSSQYLPNKFKAYCKSSFELPNITVSSANSSTIIFINTDIFSSKVSQEIPGTLFASKYPFKSFRYIENKKG